MDIAKIRKKLQEKDKGKKTGETPVPAEPAETEEVKEKEVHQETPAEVQTLLEPIEEPEDKTDTPYHEPEEKTEKGNNRSEETEDDLIELLTFGLSGEEFAFKVSLVEEIVRYQKITRVPTMPDYVLGITSLRGKIIPVIDMKNRLSISTESVNAKHTSADLSSKEEEGTQEKIIIVAGPKGLIGATIDRVIGVISVPAHEVLEPPAHLSEAEMKYIEGVVISEKRFISVIRSEDTMNIEAD